MKKRRIIPAFLVLCLIFTIVLCPAVDSAGMSGLEVIGQTGMTQQIFTDLSIIGADSCGLIDAINSSKNPAQSIGEWIKDGWDNWLLLQQLTWGTVLNIAAAGARYTANGDLLFNSQLSDLFTRFYNWLWDGEGGPNIKENAQSVPGEELDIGTVDFSKVNKSGLYYSNYTYNVQFSELVSGLKNDIVYQFKCDNGYVSAFQVANGSYNVVYVSEQGGNFYIKSGNGEFISHGTMSRVTTKIGDVYFGQIAITNMGNVVGAISTVYDNNGNKVNPNNSTYWADIAYLVFGYGVNIGEDQILGDPDKLDGLTGADTNVLAPPDIINWPDFGGNNGYIDINDYIGGLRDSIESQDGTADVNITDSEGIESTQTMEIDRTTDIPVEQETTSELVNSGEVISTATPSTELAEYTIDLRNYFPFCIPWDLYDMITLLVAEPIAPHVQYPFVIAPLNVNYTIDLDFSAFDSVAAVLRSMELLAAGIGLALMTKKLIQGGD